MGQINPEYLQKDETIEFTDRPSMASFICIIAYLWTFVMLLTTIMIFFVCLSPDTDKTMMVMSLVYLILALPSIYLILATAVTRFAITNKGIVTKTGIFVTKVKTVNYNHITSVSLKGTIFGKLLHYASLLIDTSGSGSSIDLK